MIYPFHISGDFRFDVRYGLSPGEKGAIVKIRDSPPFLRLYTVADHAGWKEIDVNNERGGEQRGFRWILVIIKNFSGTSSPISMS